MFVCLSVTDLCLQTIAALRLFSDWDTRNILEEWWADSIQGYGVILSAQYEERFGDLLSLLGNGPQYQGSRNFISKHHINIVMTIRNLAAFPIPHHGRMLINLLKTKRNLLYIRNYFVPHCKHFPPRLKN
jgi:hypothetical protein